MTNNNEYDTDKLVAAQLASAIVTNAGFHEIEDAVKIYESCLYMIAPSRKKNLGA